MRRASRIVIGLLTVLGLGLAAASVPLWLGEALFCDGSDPYCGLFWLLAGHLGLVIVGGICGWLGQSWGGLAAGLLGVVLGTLIALALESVEREPYLPLTWELFSSWVPWAVAAFGVGYVVVWGIISSVREGRQEGSER